MIRAFHDLLFSRVSFLPHCLHWSFTLTLLTFAAPCSSSMTCRRKVPVSLDHGRIRLPAFARGGLIRSAAGSKLIYRSSLEKMGLVPDVNPCTLHPLFAKSRSMSQVLANKSSGSDTIDQAGQPAQKGQDLGTGLMLKAGRRVSRIEGKTN